MECVEPLACRSAVLKTLACRGLRVGPSKFQNAALNKAIVHHEALGVEGTNPDLPFLAASIETNQGNTTDDLLLPKSRKKAENTPEGPNLEKSILGPDFMQSGFGGEIFILVRRI